MSEVQRYDIYHYGAYRCEECCGGESCEYGVEPGSEYILASDYDALTARVAELERYAARYLWLRESDTHLEEVLFVTMGDYAPVWRDDSEQAIDAAIAARQPDADGEKHGNNR